MPMIGPLGPKAAAQAFADYLATQGITLRLHPDPSGQDACFLESQVADADRVEAALAEFLSNPHAEKYRAASWRTGRPHAASFHGFSLKPLMARAGPLTRSIAVLAVLLTLYTGFGQTDRALPFMFSNQLEGFYNLAQGQIWRLFTPSLLHYWLPGLGPLHLLFNLMMFWDLAGALERRLGSRTLLGLCLVVAALSNTAQYLVSGPFFGGLSGVVYGLFGFLWLRGHYDPASGLHMPRAIAALMLGWLALCYTGLLGSVANTGHTVGLLVGMIGGYGTALLAKHR
ncbi:MAG: rhomboid family intramembrane serine protease [Gammaproteobacteria bacterium]|nr:rhomboid family intramembrane serine protease [Gammaproteobacteria bacterium]